MIKRKIDDYIRNYYETTRNALLITGARQIGKTYSIRQFGKAFKSFIEINFVEMPEAVELFKGAKNSSDILLRLSAITSAPLIKGETLVFFDEVQQCPEIVTAIKFLVDDGSYRYILSGSLLGVELKDLRSEPVGYMGVKDMFPLDFEEFISCVGINDTIIGSLREAWLNRTTVDEFVHGKIMELFRLYLVVGGMPAAVSKYIESNNLQEVMTVQQDIIRLYKRDIAQYDPNNKLYIEEIFNLIPPELNAKNKRFILKRLNEHAKFERVENSFLWLTNAGVALPVYNVEEPKMPLLLARSRNLFKLFQSDVGLLASQYAEGIQMRIIKGDKDINFGSIYENAVAQELVAHGIAPYYYNNKKRGELDFVIELDGKVLPIEVKSGKDYETHRALSNVMDCEEYDLPEAVVFNNDNLRVAGKIVYAPIYMAMFLAKNNVAPTFYKVDISGL
jgi:Predicted ATPase (AAA+ superfamily)